MLHAGLLGMQLNEGGHDRVAVGSAPGRELALQSSLRLGAASLARHLAPQQLHLDIRVDDPDAVETEVLARGGHRLPAERETGFRVFSDPVGHPFCLVFGSSGKD